MASAQREFVSRDYAAEYLTMREVANLLRITERKVYDLAASGSMLLLKTARALLQTRISHGRLVDLVQK